MSAKAHDLIAALRFHKHPLADQAANRIAELEEMLRRILEHWEPTRDDYRSDKKGVAQFEAAFHVWSDAQEVIASATLANKDRK